MAKRIHHSSGYLADHAARQLPRRLYAGTAAMQAAALAEIDMWPGPGETRNFYMAEEVAKSGGVSIYENRVRQSVLSPVWWDAVRKSALAPLRERLVLDGWRDRVGGWADNLGGAGRSRTQFLIEVLENQAVDGIALVLSTLGAAVDAEGAAAVRPLGEDDRLGRRPYAVALAADDFDPVSVANINGETILLRCLIYQEKTGRGEGGVTAEEKASALWREYELRTSGVWWKDYNLASADRDAEVVSETEWQQVQSLGTGRVTRIPVTPFYGDFTAGPYRGRPPYGRPAELAAGAWRKRADRDALGRENARLRFFQSHVPEDGQGNPKVKMMANFLYSTGEGSASVLETSGAALKALSEDLADDEDGVRSACRALAAASTSGDVTATEVGLRGLESGTYTEVVTQGNAASFAQVLRDFEALAGESPSEGSVSWPYRSTRALSDETLSRMSEAAKTFDDEGNPLLPLATWLYLERSAGNLPEKLDIAAAVAGTLEKDQ